MFAEIVTSEIGLVVHSTSEIVTAEIILDALIGILAEEAPSGSFANRLLRRAISLAAFTARLAERSTRRRIGSEASAGGTLGAPRWLGELTARSV